MEKATIAIMCLAFLLTSIQVKAQSDVKIIEPDTSAANQSKIYSSVEKEPIFPGGLQNFYQYLSTNINYPAAALKNRVQGKVFVTFVVEKDGSLTDIKVIRGLSDDIDAEAKRVIINSPKWSPGMQNGRAVRAQCTLPISFKLPDSTVADTTIYTNVDQQASPKNGIRSFYQYFEKNTRYPAIAREENRQGKEVFTLTIEKDGVISDLRVDSSICKPIDNEILRVAAGYPKWIPAVKNGQTVRSLYTITLKFVIEGNVAYIKEAD